MGKGNPKGGARAKLASLEATVPQRASANRAIGRATTASSVDVAREGEDIVVRIFRSGRDGYQMLEHVVRPDGSKRVVQYAYDSSGRPVHWDPKTP